MWCLEHFELSNQYVWQWGIYICYVFIYCLGTSFMDWSFRQLLPRTSHACADSVCFHFFFSPLFRRSKGILYSRGAELRTLNCIKEMGFKLWPSRGRYWRNKPGIIVGQKGIWKFIVNPNPSSEDGVELFGYEEFWHGWTIDEDVILLACVSFHTFRNFSKQEESVKAFSYLHFHNALPRLKMAI